MKKKYALIVLMVFAIGCAAGRTQIIQPQKYGFKNYPVLEMTDFKSYAGSEFPQEGCQRLPDSIAKELAALNLFQAVNRIPVVTEWKCKTKTLVIQGTVVEYDPGSQAKRYTAGTFGWGKGFATVQLVAIDKATKEEIFKANVGSEISGGFFGGSFEGAVEKLVEEAVECIQARY